MLEQSLVKKIGKNIKGVIGIDEVGRGPLAGPVTVCAVYIEKETIVRRDMFQNIIRDSKKINKTLRNNIYQTIRKFRYNKCVIRYAISSRSATYVDRYGIAESARKCVRSCLHSLERQGIAVDMVPIRLDAGLYAPEKYPNQESFIKGDERFVEIALASIIAKEWRDAYMRRMAKEFPEYGWSQNVGYGTQKHREAIRRHGTTRMHRRTYLKRF